MLSVALKVWLLSVAGALAAGPFGQAQKPPMGWRSWNAFHNNIDQDSMQVIMDIMAVRNRTVDGKKVSLLDLGYNNVGLDDNWQACRTGVNGSFHDINGRPLINKQRFPSMKGMCDHAHGLGLHCGWYFNNCDCKETMFTDPAMIDRIYRSSVQAIVDYGFDGVKIDGCSQFHNSSLWASLMNASGRPILVENCHDSHPTYPTDPAGTCPYNFFRTSTDINPSWASVVGNLQTTKKYQGNPPLSRPGCWAYPDMLEVGNLKTHAEDRSHFGAWCIVSSPLILGFDLRNHQKMDQAWDIISNVEAIAVNQAWAGHPGKQVKTWNPSPPKPPALGEKVYAVTCDSSDSTQGGWSLDATKTAVVGPGGKCLDASNTKEIALKTCDGSASQQFKLSSAGTLDSISKPGFCIDIYAGHGQPWGPGVQLYRCHSGKNEQFAFEANGRLSSQGAVCLAGRDTTPPASGGSVELWMKPLQAHGTKLAAFVLNTGAAQNVSVDLADLNITGAAKVRDIWAKKDLGTAKGSLALNIGEHDSAFLVFSQEPSVVI